MKAVSSLLIFFLLFIGGSGYSQTKTKAKPKKVPVEHIPYQDYSYPYYAIVNTGSTPVAGCFINYKGQSYFVTTRHSFYTTTNERRKITNVMIFLDPDNIKNSSKVLSLNMTEQKLLPVCFDSGCIDIILLPVTIPRDLSVNFVHLEPKDVILHKEMAIVGYVKDTLNIVETKFDSFSERDTTFFLTEKSSPMEQSGSPVIMYNRNKTGSSKFTLAGIYAGKEISKEHFDKGLVSKASYITRFLDAKEKEELEEKQKATKPKKAKRP